MPGGEGASGGREEDEEREPGREEVKEQRGV